MKRAVSGQLRCPRCRENLFLDKEHYGWYEHCLRCGYVRTVGKILKTTGARVNTGQFREFAKVGG